MDSELTIGISCLNPFIGNPDDVGIVKHKIEKYLLFQRFYIEILDAFSEGKTIEEVIDRKLDLYNASDEPTKEILKRLLDKVVPAFSNRSL